MIGQMDAGVFYGSNAVGYLDIMIGERTRLRVSNESIVTIRRAEACVQALEQRERRMWGYVWKPTVQRG